MKIVDCFIFYNELEMLEYRLNTLYNYVDYFVIVESRITHSGKEKPLYYEDNKERYEVYHSKIIHIILDNLLFKYPNIDYSQKEQWKNENFQRNAINNGINKINLNDEDIILISDLDEIPDCNIISNVKNETLVINNIYSLEQDFYYYNLNSRLLIKWGCAKILSFKKYKELNLPCQDIRHLECESIKKGGWHLSYFGDKYFIQNKINHFGHQEFNNDKYTNLEIIETIIKNQTDLYGRDDEKIENIPIKNNDYLPPNYEKFLSKFITN